MRTGFSFERSFHSELTMRSVMGRQSIGVSFSEPDSICCSAMVINNCMALSSLPSYESHGLRFSRWHSTRRVITLYRSIRWSLRNCWISSTDAYTSRQFFLCSF